MKVDKLVKNVYETIMASGMICQGDSVVVGVSGGADSVCLPVSYTHLTLLTISRV